MDRTAGQGADNTTAPDATAADKAARALPPSNQTIAEIAEAQGFTPLLDPTILEEQGPFAAIDAVILPVDLGL